MKTNLFNLQLFAFVAGETAGTPTTNPINVTTQESMSATNKTFFDTTLLENSREENVFGQFSMKQPIKGNKVEWRKFNKFEKALTPLKEGVIPSGQEFGMTSITATVTQHGAYVAISDRLEHEAYDDVIFGASEEMGATAGETKDTLTRNILSASATVAYCPIGDTKVESDSALTSAAILTSKMVNRAATWLKKNKAPKIDGKYIAIIHPSVAEDLRESEGWKSAHIYAATTEIFNGEIGELHNVRFIESTACRITKTGASGGAVYETYFMGKDAYAEIEPNGESMQLIIKGKESAGGPLEQFSTIGFKFVHSAKIIYPERFLVVKSGSSYSDIDEAN